MSTQQLGILNIGLMVLSLIPTFFVSGRDIPSRDQTEELRSIFRGNRAASTTSEVEILP
ncbi:MAG TPA: hypothetical protein VIX80_08640 [Candidatus Kapabacteria bacterium]